jgi:hypothetical protein
MVVMPLWYGRIDPDGSNNRPCNDKQARRKTRDNRHFAAEGHFERCDYVHGNCNQSDLSQYIECTIDDPENPL